MLFESNMSILYSDTLIPDIFISDYMPSLDSDFVKVYIYCIFLSKHNKHLTTEEISRALHIDMNKVKEALLTLETLGVISKKAESIIVVDLKEKEIKKTYRMKTTSSPEEAISNSKRNKKRNEAMKSINASYFQGLMSPSWYTDIDAWFDRFKFDEDVMVSLFSHCAKYRGVEKNYILKVAESWYSKNIKNEFDLDKYHEEFENFKNISKLISRKLKLMRNLTEYEEEYIEKWVMEYKYEFDIIELSLKKTTAKTNPNFKYIHAILNDWYNKGLRTKEEIITYEKSKKHTSDKSPSTTNTVPQSGNYEQRTYDDDYYNSLYKNARKSKTI